MRPRRRARSSRFRACLLPFFFRCALSSVAACDDRPPVLEPDADIETPDASGRAGAGSPKKAARRDAVRELVDATPDAGADAATAAIDAAPPEDAAASTSDASKPQFDAATTPTVPASTSATVPSEDDDAGAPDHAATPEADGGKAPAEEPEMPLPHDFFSTVFVEDGASAAPLGDGDLWPTCWSDDDVLYAAGGDGFGFGPGMLVNDVFVARIDGTPDGSAPMRGTTLSTSAEVSSIWSGVDYNRKPTGMLCLGGDLYLAVQDLRLQTFTDAPAATIVRSRDKGRSWTWDREAPMFADHVFTTIMFLDFGKDAEHAPPDYVYAYGLDDNWSFQTFDRPPPTSLYLARMPRDGVQARERWEFFTGFDAERQPEWSTDIDARAPVLEDTRRVYTRPIETGRHYQDMTVINQGGIAYVAPLKRFLYTSWTEYTFEFYEAPAPWGPWKLFYSKDFGVMPWTSARNGGYATTIPSKFISSDGTSMWLQSNAWALTGANNYNFSLREVRLNSYAPSAASNARSPRSLATEEEGAVPIGRAFRAGQPQVLNDGITLNQSEDSWTGERKPEDYWGYTWPKSLYFDAVRYTSGHKTAEGGWFEALEVQVRRGETWVPVTNLRIDPMYPGDAGVPDFATYTLKFDAITGDGLRLFGKPGGSGAFTSIAELSVHYE